MMTVMSDDYCVSMGVLCVVLLFVVPLFGLSLPTKLVNQSYFHGYGYGEQ